MSCPIRCRPPQQMHFFFWISQKWVSICPDMRSDIILSVVRRSFGEQYASEASRGAELPQESSVGFLGVHSCHHHPGNRRLQWVFPFISLPSDRKRPKKMKKPVRRGSAACCSGLQLKDRFANWCGRLLIRVTPNSLIKQRPGQAACVCRSFREAGSGLSLLQTGSALQSECLNPVRLHAGFRMWNQRFADRVNVAQSGWESHLQSGQIISCYMQMCRRQCVCVCVCVCVEPEPEPEPSISSSGLWVCLNFRREHSD